MSTPKAVTQYSDIEGWFNWQDRALFKTLLDAQQGRNGTLVELGAYLGRSAVVMGEHRHPAERFVVVDLFGSEDDLADSSEDAANKRENRFSYRSLTRDRFEENYLALHTELPEVVQGLSTEVIKHVEPDEARFVHIDASHLYHQVVEDIVNVRSILRTDGVVVFDDFRAEHTPGVAAAVWEAAADGLHPFAITAHKLYATWGDPAPYLAAVRAYVKTDHRVVGSDLVVHSDTIVRVRTAKKKAAAATPAAGPLDDAGLERLAGRVADLVSEKVAKKQARRTPSGGRADWVPPVLARKIRERRSR